MAVVARVDVFSHNFKVSKYQREFYLLLKDFCRPLIQTGLEPRPGGRFVPTMLKVFAASNAARTEMRFSIAKFNEFLEFCKQRGYDQSRLEIVSQPLFKPAKLVSEFMDSWVLRDYQVPVVAFETEENKPIRVVVVQTGKGKGLMSLKAAAELGYRVIVIVPAMYTEKWYEEIQTMFKDVKKRMLLVKGYKQLCNLVSMVKAGCLDHDFIVVSQTTMQIFLRNWEMESAVTEGMCCHPEKFYETIGAGTKIIDELHKGIHINIKMDLYTNIPKGLYLTATIRASNPFINKMTEMAYPAGDRYKGLEYDRYIGVVAMEYRLQNPRAVKWIGRKKEYSQIKFEESILRSPKMRDNYLRMVEFLVKTEYVDIMEAKQTCIVFAGSIEMCTSIARHLKRRFPDLKVGRYVGEDDYDELMNNDIVVSTILSAGTAIDKYGLITVIMTQAIDSIQANEQTMGRLRRLKDWPDKTPMFFYLVCGDIDKHVTYHDRKVELLADKALWQRYEILPYRI